MSLLLLLLLLLLSARSTVRCELGWVLGVGVMGRVLEGVLGVGVMEETALG